MEVWNRLAGIATSLGLKKTGEFSVRNAYLYSYNVLTFACVLTMCHLFRIEEAEA